jgi:hypothetical protein
VERVNRFAGSIGEIPDERLASRAIHGFGGAELAERSMLDERPSGLTLTLYVFGSSR